MCFPLGITMETAATEPLSDHNRSSGVSDGDTDYVEMDPSRRYGRYKEVLGKGAFKKVYRAFDEVEGIEVAWNQVKIEDAACIPEELERLQSEIHLLRTLRHKNVIKFYHSWVDTSNQNINFITEIFTSGTLRQYRKKHKHVDLKAEKNWARQILRGLLYLHSHDPPIIHRDLKCDNIFINGNHGEVKIGDLGLATILQQAHAAHSVIGTPEFMAPELYEEDYNELADIYSFGMCLLEMVTSEYPYSECANAAQIYKKVTSGIKPAALERVKDSEVRQFIEKCLAPVSRRLPARELLADAFLRLDESSREAQECPPLPKQLQASSANNASLAKSDSEKATCSMGISSIEGSSDKGLTPPSNDQDKDDKDKDAQDKELIFSSEFSTEEQLKSQDFKVKGKKKDDNTVFLRIRIADTEGNIRNIHFLFDLVGDSALSVASEMVEELDLSGQVVTTIADMIDSEIIALVPKWKPGVSLDETPRASENPQSNKVTLEGSMESNCITAIAPPPSYALVERLSPLRNSTLRLKPSLASPSTIRGGEATTMFGRFEEVTYNKGKPEVLSSSLSSPHIRLAFSSDSSEMCGDEEGMSSSNELAESKRETVGKAATSCCVMLGLSDEEEADLNEELQILKNKQGEELRELERRYRSSVIDLHSRWKRKGNNSNNNNPSNESITLVNEMVGSGSVTDQGRTSLDLDIASSSDNHNTNMLGNGHGEQSYYHDIRQAALSRFLSDASSLANNGASNNDNTIPYSNPERDNVYTGKQESKQNGSDCIHEQHVEE